MSLHIDSLTCIRQDRLIFADLSFSLSAGEMMWVKGRNGVGKSSLLRILAGLLAPAAGKVSWNGTDIADEPDIYHQNFRYIAHQDALKAAFSARENLDFWADYAGQDQVLAALQAFELQDIADHPVRILSAGQKKRSNLARLIACPAPLWILDEPVSSLDSHYIKLFKSLLLAHVTKGGMAILATHQDLEIDNIRILDLDRKGTALC